MSEKVYFEIQADNQQQNIDSYIKTFSTKTQTVLKKIKKIIKDAAPKAEESISYGIPTFKINGKPLIYFAGFKNHVSLYPIMASIKQKFKKELVGLKMSTGTIQFSLNKPIPYNLIKKLAKEQIKARLNIINNN
ncbi:MAG TPA: DUF1801 domain-containing protein [Verrucomicrobiae bacterium]|nr:DUF1801 domain-containing protein [Verrucomicrobiae bacterium]